MRADLAEMQRKFADALLDVDLVSTVLPQFRGDTEVNRERFAFYRGNISAIWQQSSASAFPVLLQLVGPAFFGDLTRAYGKAYPSQVGDLNQFGKSMAEFIDTLDNCRAFPYLGDVASLEWQVHSAYYAKHCPGVTLNDLAAIPPTELGNLVFELQPSSALVSSPWAIHDIWHAHQTERPVMPEVLANPSHCLVWRQPWTTGWRVQVRELSAASYALLLALSKGDVLGAAIEKAFALDPEFAFQNELAEWLNMQLIISIKPDQSSI